MRNTITRTITESTIYAVKLEIDNGQPVIAELPPVTVVGTISHDKALKAVYAEHGKQAGVNILRVEEREFLYEISVTDFMKYAKRVDNSTEDTDNE